MTVTRGGPSGSAELGEIEELRLRLRSLREEATANEQKWQRLLEREIELLRADTLPEFLAIVTTGLQASYGLDAVQLVVEDPNHETQHLLLGAGQRAEELTAVTFVDTLVGLAPQIGAIRQPWLGNWVRADHELLFPGAAGLRTLALLPLRRQARTVGVLCFGSGDPERFSHRLRTDFLQHLASVVAVCLENACNRARLLSSGLTDYLTGWHNRRYLHGRLREELARAQRAGSTVACMMIDVDHFKQLNDTYGHLGGDEVLREIAARIELQIRASDTAARFGGDEFTLLLPEATLEDGARLGERIRAAMAAPVDVGDDRLHAVSLSIGVAALRPSREDRDLMALSERLLAEADAALYRAKAAGRNRVAVSDP